MDKYEQHLQACAARLQSALPVGQVKAIGLLEVMAGIDLLIAERDELRKRLGIYAIPQQLFTETAT